MHKLLSQTLPLLAASALATMPGRARAAGSPAETLAQMLAASGITESGYIAASYYHSSGGNTYHEFDTGHDSFQLDQAGLTLAYQPSQGFGALVDMIAGDDAKIINAAESASSSSNNMFDLLQSFVQYVNGGLTIQVGKFTTLAGAEVIAPTGNLNFSRSLLFFAEPMTHTGLRATYEVNHALSLIVGVNNGWNYTNVNAGSKTGEFGLALTPDKSLSITAQAYIGNDPVDLAKRTFFDTVWTYNATSALSFVVSYDWGRQDASSVTRGGEWDGVAGYVNYWLNKRWRVALRGEELDDRNGFILGTGTPQKVKEGTLTVGYDPVPSFELRIEGRYDTSNRPTFTYTRVSAATGKPVTTFSTHQTEFALQGVYKF
jgi:hypothetical protein